MTDFVSHPCPRIIHSSKYEKQGSDAFNWWCRLFEIMEKDYKIPLHQRKEVIKEIFPENILEKILTLILNASTEHISRYARKAHSASTVTRTKSESETKFNEGHRDSILTQYATGTDIYCHRVVSFGVDRKDAGPNNPYINFFRRRPDRAAIWRDLPPLSLEEMDLNQKAEAVTEAIAIDFIKWLKKLGGETETKLDVPQVVKMFEIGFSTHAATSLAGIVKELPAVTKAVSDYRQMQQKSFRAKLHEKIQEDMKLLTKKERLIAFGSTLPKELRCIPPKVDTTTKWFKLDRPYKYLQNMSAVWEGITHLRSTRAFCLWLIDNPKYPAPNYLRECGMLEPAFYERPHYSVDSQESGNQNTNEVQ